MAERQVVTPDDLNAVMEMWHVVEVHADGTVSDAPPHVSGPESVHSDDEGLDVGDGWSLLKGYSGQDRYNGPHMHSSEFIGGRLAQDILAQPGYYVAVIVTSLAEEDNDETHPDYTGDNAVAWAVAYKPAEQASDEPLMVDYQDVRESLALILAVTTDPAEVLASLDDAVSNNLGD